MKHTLHWEMTPMDKNGIFGLQKGQHQSFESREHSRPSNTEEWSQQNSEQHQRSLLETFGDQNLARMHSLDLETNERKSRKASSLDLSFVPEVREHN